MKAEIETNHIPVVVYGPPACGKTYNADAIRAAFGLDGIVDEWWPGEEALPGAVHLTAAMEDDLAPFDIRKVPFSHAMALVNLERIRTGRAAKPVAQPNWHSDCAKETGIRPGDTVIIRGGGVAMTVVDACCSEAECVWFDGSVLNETTLPLAALIVQEVDHGPF